MKTKTFFLSLVAIAAAGQLFAQDIDLDSLYDARIRSTLIRTETVEVLRPVEEQPEEVVVENAFSEGPFEEIVESDYDDPTDIIVGEPAVADSVEVAEVASEQIEIEAVKVGTYAIAVNIDGLLWASRNVGEPGEMVTERADAGGYYTFDEAQTACPEGWRLPTTEEVEQLCSANNRWTNPDGENLKRKRFRKRQGNGMSFGESDNYVFLPAGGYLDSRGKKVTKYPSGFYWTSEKTNDPVTDKNHARGKYLRFHDKKVYLSNNPNFDGKFTVRCVK